MSDNADSNSKAEESPSSPPEVSSDVVNNETQAIEPAVVPAGEGQVEGQQNDAANNRQPTAGESFFAVAKSLIIRGIIIYVITSYFRRPQQPTPPPGDGDPPDGTVRTPAVNIFEDGTIYDMYVYVNEEDTFSQFNNDKSLIWYKEDLVYGDWSSGDDGDGTYTKSITLVPSKDLINNGSIYIHVFLVKSGFSPDPDAGEGSYHRQWTMTMSQQINKFKKRRFRKTSNLLTGETKLTKDEIRKAETTKTEITSHWHPNITVNIIHDFTQWTRGSVPPPLDVFVEFSPIGDKYKPILFLNTYWNLVKDYQAINTSIESLDLVLTFQPLSLFKWQLYAAQAMKNKWPGAAMLEGLNGGEDEDDQDALKEAFLETSPYLLGLTIAVSILHSIFEFLAFKNDIQFWNNRQSLEGLSVRSVFFNVFQSVVVLLYVLDNETNFVIKVSCFVGLAIELWKITKVMDVSINYEHRIMGIPTLSLKDKSTYVHSSTRQYDELAFRYLSFALFPLLGGYCIYSLFYQEHSGWYSFVLSMLYGFLLTFGFIMMTPQLFINYKLKSVAHLPWRMLTYKALNTFIDDIFAFVIKMPTMYRIGCLRDDVIFFIFLYQRYIYRVDPSRLNEFGFSQDMEKAVKENKSQPTLENGNTTNDAPTDDVTSEPIKSVEDKKED